MSSSNGVTAFQIDGPTGVLTKIGSTYPAGSNPKPLVIANSGEFLYVGNTTSFSISGFKIYSTTGTLEAIPGSPFAMGGSGSLSPKYLYFETIGGNLYASTGTGCKVCGFSIDPSTGALSQITGSPYDISVSGSYGMSTDNALDFYVAGYSSIEGFNFGGAGQLVPMTNRYFGAATQVQDLICAGAFVYSAGGSVSGKIHAYSSGAAGVLSEIAESPYDAGNGPTFMATDSQDKFLYVTNYSGSSLNAYTVDHSTGTLTAVAGSPYWGLTNPNQLAVGPDDKFLYVPNNGNDSYMIYSINASSGALTPIPGIPFATPDPLPPVGFVTVKKTP